MTFQEQTKLYLKEGIEYFKYSKRFNKLIKIMEENLKYAENKEEILELIEEFKQAAKDFKEAEDEYKVSRYSGMMKYKILKIQYKNLVAKARKETVRKFFATFRGLGLIGNLIYFLEKKW